MEELSVNKNSRWLAILIIEMIVLAMLIAPILVATTFAVPCDDDFSNSLSYVMGDGFSIELLISNAISTYKGWQGTFSGNVFVLIPTYLLGGATALRLELFIVTTFFFVACTIFSKSFIVFWRLDGKNKLETAVYTLLVLILLLGYVFTIPEVGEFFYWHTGIGMYTLPLSFGMISIYCLITSERKTSKLRISAGALLGFLAAGAALDVVAFICFIMLCITAIEYNTVRKWQSYYWIFIVTLLGALVNTVAPGNYIRHGSFDEKVRFGKALGMSAYRVNCQFLKGTSERGLLILIVVTAIMVYTTKVEPRVQSLVILAIACYVGVLVTDYPVVLGGSSISLPRRCEVVENLAIAVSAVAFGIGVGLLLKKRFIYTRVLQSFGVIVLILQIVLLFKNGEIQHYTSIRTARNIMNGEYARVAREELLALETIKNVKDNDVVLDSFGGNYWVDIKEVELTGDAEYWVNQSVARFYGKETVRVRE